MEREAVRGAARRVSGVISARRRGVAAATAALPPLPARSMFQPDIATLTVHLTGTTNATLVYAALDDDTMAVSITEVPPAGKRAAPVVQTGFMFRMHS